MKIVTKAAFVLVAALACGHVRADPVADFYAGKQISMIVPSGVGGGYDLYGRFVARHMQRHIPGTPAIIVRNMPGAGGVAAANHLYSVAARDGLHMGIFQNTITLNQVTKSNVVKFDVREFGWIGNAAAASSICAFGGDKKDAPIKDIFTREIVLGASSGSVKMVPLLLNSLAATKFKVTAGYQSTSNVTLAMERGEIDGLCGWSWDGARVNAKDMLARGVAKVQLDIAVEPQPELVEMKVPFLMDMLPDGENKQVLNAILTTQLYNRPFGTTPGVPADRLAALRSAFEKIGTDREAMAEADKIGLDFTYMSPARIRELISIALDAPQRIQDRMAEELRLAGFGG